jgi:hypothetical protein
MMLIWHEVDLDQGKPVAKGTALTIVAQKGVHNAQHDRKRRNVAWVDGDLDHANVVVARHHDGLHRFDCIG